MGRKLLAVGFRGRPGRDDLSHGRSAEPRGRPVAREASGSGWRPQFARGGKGPCRLGLRVGRRVLSGRDFALARGCVAIDARVLVHPPRVRPKSAAFAGNHGLSRGLVSRARLIRTSCSEKVKLYTIIIHANSVRGMHQRGPPLRSRGTRLLGIVAPDIDMPKAELMARCARGEETCRESLAGRRRRRRTRRPAPQEDAVNARSSSFSSI